MRQPLHINHPTPLLPPKNPPSLTPALPKLRHTQTPRSPMRTHIVKLRLTEFRGHPQLIFRTVGSSDLQTPAVARGEAEVVPGGLAEVEAVGFAPRAVRGGGAEEVDEVVYIGVFLAAGYGVLVVFCYHFVGTCGGCRGGVGEG